MKYFQTTFRKKDGTLREIKYIELEQIMSLSEQQKALFSLRDYKQDTKPRTLQEGSRLVFDIDNKDFRIINFNALETEIEQKELDYEQK